MYAYTGHTDCAIQTDGTITSPASALHDEYAVICRWTKNGYRAPDEHPEWLDEYLDDDGCLR